MEKKDWSDLDLETRSRILKLCKDIEALDTGIDELQKRANTVENADQKLDLLATIVRMKEDKEDVKKGLLRELLNSDDDDECRNVELDDPNNTERSYGQGLIDETKRKLDSSNLGDTNLSGFGGIDDQEQMNSDHHFPNKNKPQESKRPRNEDKTMIQWLKETHKSNEIEEYALELGAQLSEIVVDLSMFMSERQDLKPRFQEFKSSLENLSMTYNCVVSRKIFSLLEVAERELKDTEESKNELAAMEEENDRYESPHKETPVDGLLEQLLEEIDCLGDICGIPCPKEPITPTKEVSLSMENALRQFQRKMSVVRIKVNEFKRIFSSTEKNEDQKAKEFWKKMNGMISDQVWNQLEESGPKIKRQKV